MIRGNSETLDLVKIAFRKLKAHVYFDKTALPLRDRVVAFESSFDFEAKLQEIANAYNDASLDHDSPLIQEILLSISVLSFPKKMKDTKLNHKDDNKDIDRNVISVGNPKEKPIVSEQQHFINMDVSGHILGVLWIMMFGKGLDESCFKNSRGNRLREKLIWNEDESIIKDSPALFEPYFAQYSLWRDDGLSCAEDLLSKGHDTLILTLDLKRFYYRAGVTAEAFNDIIKDEDDRKKKSLHLAMFSIIQSYTQKLRNSSVDCSGNVLPIGFLPSAVLANWCLSNFDKGILDFWNPSYYGRYVDDIIIVEKVEKNSEIYKRARGNDLSKDYVIDYYLGKGRRKDARSFVDQDSYKSNYKTENNRTTNNQDSDISYKVNAAFCLSLESNLEFEQNKTRVIALFSENNSTALINKFKKEIYENVSEFRLMPEIGEAFSQDDFSYFYRLENDATINKLRGIKDIVMDKYELSKFLGKYLIVSRLIDDGNAKKFTRKIGKMFNDRELIEYYILWERVFEIYITDKDYVGFSKFTERIKTAIKALTFTPEDRAGTGIEVKNIQDSLILHLSATLNRVLSLIWGEKSKEPLLSVNKTKDCDIALKIGLRRAYIDTRMSNKYVISIPMENIIVPSNEPDVNFTDFSESFKFLCDNPTAANSTHDTLLPYFRQAQDIAIDMFINMICNCDESQQAIHKNYIEAIHKESQNPPINIGSVSVDKASTVCEPALLSVGDKKNHKIKIAIANVSVGGVWNLENALKGRKPNRKSERYKALAKLVNEAIVENADMLVFPENYIPFEWLPSLATKAAREGLAIITGVEHMIVGKSVYNYTAMILPFKYHDTIPTSAIFFQLKKYYSPEEKRIIEGYGFEAIEETKMRPLYRWNDCYFPVYCCYELTDIKDRSEFMSWADMVVAVEYNKDTNYFGNIVESLTRDLHCYCVQVNTSEYGDSRITQPKQTVEQNIIVVKGGTNSALLIDEIDIQSLREFQITKYSLQKSGKKGLFKPTPPGIDPNVIHYKLKQRDDKVT